MKFNQNDPRFIIYLDLIGRELDAKHKTNPKWSTFRKLGTVLNETRNTLFVKNSHQIKQYVKDHFIFRCWLLQPHGIAKCVEFDGNKVIGKPEQRIKKLRKINRRKLH